MKLLKPDEIKAAKESELGRDILRTEAIKKALDSVKTELNDTNARFELALSTQQVRWAKEEEAAMKRIQALAAEVKSLEDRRATALIPIDELKKKAQDMFTNAEKVMDTATALKAKFEDELRQQVKTTELLQDKLDSLSDREEALNGREQKLLIREQANDADRQTIKALSGELLTKLNKL